MIEHRIVQLIGKYQKEAHSLRPLRSVSAKTGVLVFDEVVNDLRSALDMEDHQHVVWLAGANPPHYEIRGTGLVYDGPRRTPK